jgi:hypothetical protein
MFCFDAANNCATARTHAITQCRAHAHSLHSLMSFFEDSLSTVAIALHAGINRSYARTFLTCYNCLCTVSMVQRVVDSARRTNVIATLSLAPHTCTHQLQEVRSDDGDLCVPVLDDDVERLHEATMNRYATNAITLHHTQSHTHLISGRRWRRSR